MLVCSVNVVFHNHTFFYHPKSLISAIFLQFLWRKMLLKFQHLTYLLLAADPSKILGINLFYENVYICLSSVTEKGTVKPV